MEATLEEIRSGDFSKEWAREYENGYPHLDALLRAQGRAGTVVAGTAHAQPARGRNRKRIALIPREIREFQIRPVGAFR